MRFHLDGGSFVPIHLQVIRSGAFAWVRVCSCSCARIRLCVHVCSSLSMFLCVCLFDASTRAFVLRAVGLSVIHERFDLLVSHWNLNDLRYQVLVTREMVHAMEPPADSTGQEPE